MQGRKGGTEFILRFLKRPLFSNKSCLKNIIYRLELCYGIFTS